jgi:peroxisomal membrane protein 4
VALTWHRGPHCGSRARARPQYAYEIYAAVCWGLVMYLFFHHEGTLQASLISSMTYLYIDSEKWPETGNPIEWLLN